MVKSSGGFDSAPAARRVELPKDREALERENERKLEAEERQREAAGD